jgi:hypothetical protein
MTLFHLLAAFGGLLVCLDLLEMAVQELKSLKPPKN